MGFGMGNAHHRRREGFLFHASGGNDVHYIMAVDVSCMN